MDGSNPPRCSDADKGLFRVISGCFGLFFKICFSRYENNAGQWGRRRDKDRFCGGKAMDISQWLLASGY